METDGDVSVILPLPPSKAQARTSKPTLEKSLRRTGYTFDERMLLHRDPDDDHPEQPARIEGILEQLQEAGLLERCTRVLAGEFPNEAALATHSSEHLDFVNDLARADKELLAESSKSLDSLYLCRESEISAKAAVACTAGLAVEIALGKLSNGFAIVRPPGHHAEPEEVPNILSYFKMFS